jgi:hypothetical protein
MLGAQKRHVTPGGFAQGKPKRAEWFRSNKDVREAAARVLEKRGVVEVDNSRKW